MRYKLIGGENLGNNVYVAQHLISEDGSEYYDLNEVIRRVKEYDNLRIKANRLETKLWHIRKELSEAEHS